MGWVERAIAAFPPQDVLSCPTQIWLGEYPILACEPTPAPGTPLAQHQANPPAPSEEFTLPPSEAAPATVLPATVPPLDLDPTIIQQSPVLQRWLQGIPDIADEIRHQPSFRPRLRLGYAQFPSNGNVGGIQAAIEDVFLIPGAGLTASADYYGSFDGQRQSYGVEARYYLLPLGGYVNLAPVVGYRALSTPTYRTDGLDLGVRLMLIPSRGGAADLAISQQWVAPGSVNEVGITSFTLGYAVTAHLRLASNLQFQNSRFGQESLWGLSLEWLP
ncbi:MAG TPA: hypothetical protein IGR64_07185 [Leptolyngbyaceae cyanobacterium M65_K2018_010]|nr:hypothetical protein [Leptolyngbyaceae cyanobacterium M65_K2018_010]